MRASLAAAVAAAAVAAGLGACGGSSTPPLTHSGLDLEANAICGKVDAEGQAIPQPASFTNASEVAVYLDKFEPLVASVTAKLSAIKPDHADLSKWNALLSAERAGLAFIRKLDARAHRGELAGLSAMFANGSVTRTLRAAAEAVGADRCG